jgi:membrane protease YdiL (CAAX protease family)
MASFYGAIDEELMMRLGLLSLLALGLRTLWRAAGAVRSDPLPSSVFWSANVLAAVLFGLGHLPATAALAPLTSDVIVRAIVLNGTGGLVFGMLFKRFGLEWAMAAHFGADLVLHVAGG